MPQLDQIQPFPGPRSVVLIDNASIHKSPEFVAEVWPVLTPEHSLLTELMWGYPCVGPPSRSDSPFYATILLGPHPIGQWCIWSHQTLATSQWVTDSRGRHQHASCNAPGA